MCICSASLQSMAGTRMTISFNTLCMHSKISMMHTNFQRHLHNREKWYGPIEKSYGTHYFCKEIPLMFCHGPKPARVFLHKNYGYHTTFQWVCTIFYLSCKWPFSLLKTSFTNTNLKMLSFHSDLRQLALISMTLQHLYFDRLIEPFFIS